MTLREYIEEQFPITQLVERFTSNPFQRVMEADDLPYDKICVYEGQLQKVVEVSDDEYIPVVELLSYDEKDLGKCSQDFVDVWHAYMENISVKDMDVQEIIQVSKKYRENQERKKAQLS